MAVLSSELLQEFAKAVAPPDNSPKETTVYGTARVDSNGVYAMIDGSDIYTPVNLAVTVSDGDRVMVLLKNRQATVTGNLTNQGGGGGGGVTSYVLLTDKPSIEGVVLQGDKTFEDLTLESITNFELEAMLT